MNLRESFASDEANAEAYYGFISPRVKDGAKVDVNLAWSGTIRFDRPLGMSAYSAGAGNTLLGLLPFYDFLYVTVPSGYLWYFDKKHADYIQGDDTFRRCFGVDTRYFLDLIEAGKIIPVFVENETNYSDFVINQIWGYLVGRGLRYILKSQLDSISMAFQSVSRIMLPWEEPEKDAWWTEMMIKASALNGRLIGNFPSNYDRFTASKKDFDKYYEKTRITPIVLESQKLHFITQGLGIAYSSNVPVSNYVDVLNSHSTKILREIFESISTIEQSSGDIILSTVQQYNMQIKDLADSHGFKCTELVSDLFTKHILAVSLGIVAGATGDLVLGAAGLVVGEIVGQVIEAIEGKSERLIKPARRGLTHELSKVLGKDSNIVHLCMMQKELKK